MKKNKIKLFFTFMAAILFGFCFSSCDFGQVTELEFTGAIKQEFHLGDELDVTVNVKIDDEVTPIQVHVSSTGVLTKVNGYDIVVNGFHTSTIGAGTYVIKLNGSSISCYYTVVDQTQVPLIGSGTSSSPYEIQSTTNWLEMVEKINGKDTKASPKTIYAKLLQDINFSGIDYTPIVLEFDGFSLNGNNKTISNIAVTTTKSYQGLFGKVNGLKVQALTLKGVEVISQGETYNTPAVKTDLPTVLWDGTSSDTLVGGASVGVLAGQTTGEVLIKNVTIENSYAKGNAYVGAFIGAAQSGTVSFENCVVEDTILLANYTNAESIVSKARNAKKVGVLIGQSGASSITVSDVTIGVEIYGVRDLGLLVGFLNVSTTSKQPLHLTGDLHILDNTKVVATATTSSGQPLSIVSSAKHAQAEASAGVMIGTINVGSNLERSTVDSFLEIATMLQFRIFLGDTSVIYSKIGYLSEVPATSKLYLVSTNSTYGVNTRFIGVIRSGSVYTVPE